MTRQQAEPGLDVQDLGSWIGESLGQGIAEGIQSALAEVSAEFAPLIEDLLGLLRRDLVAAGTAGVLDALDGPGILDELLDERRPIMSTEADERLAAIARAESAHPCEEAGCGEPAVARSLCRRHYARRLYQERKERLGAHGYRVVQASAYGSTPVTEKKPSVPVGPIIRRKRNEPETAIAAAASVLPPPPPAPAEIAASPMAAAAAANGVTVESVARFLLGKG